MNKLGTLQVHCTLMSHLQHCSPIITVHPLLTHHHLKTCSEDNNDKYNYDENHDGDCDQNDDDDDDAMKWDV